MNKKLSIAMLIAASSVFAAPAFAADRSGATCADLPSFAQLQRALAASVNSCNVKFPFDTAALIVYTSLDSDHMILKVNFNVSGI
jgi:hypothetical protein